MKRKISCKLSGVVGREADGAMTVDYVYITGGMMEDGETEVPEFTNGGTPKFSSYNDLRTYAPNILAYQYDPSYSYPNTNPTYFITGPEYGLYQNTVGIVSPYSIYRREYVPNPDNVNDPYYVGEWEPVIIQTTEGYIRDYNITSHRKYQYVLYPIGWGVACYANASATDVIPIIFNCWSLSELVPIDLNLQTNTPTVKKAYTVDENNVWLFKYNTEFGSQTQNVSKTEQSTLGQYPRFAHGLRNNLTGSVTALLGSEIIPYSDTRYVERLRNSTTTAPLTSNQRIEMLQKWRQILYSKNPKLLKDMKGQSWIVQINGGSNTPKQYVRGMPDSISFTWTEIEDTANVVITGDIKDLRLTDYDKETAEIVKDWKE